MAATELIPSGVIDTTSFAISNGDGGSMPVDLFDGTNSPNVTSGLPAFIAFGVFLG